MSVIYGTPDELGLSHGQISHFYRNYWPKRSPLADESLYDYLYCQPTELGVPGEASTVAWDNSTKTIVAAMAARARSFFLSDGRVLNGVEMSTWLVHPQHRSGGVGVRVLNTLMDRSDFCLGASITPSARNIYLRLGFRWQPALQRFVYLIDSTQLGGLISDPNFAQRVSNARARLDAPSVSLTYVDLSTFEGVDVIHGAAAFDRRASALRWRYLQNPFYSYRAVRFESDDQSTVVIYRLEPVNDQFVLRVVDIVGPLSAMAIVPIGLQKLGESESAIAVDCFCSHVSAGDSFAKAGWFVLPDDECFMDIPHLLAPPSSVSPNSFSIVSWIHPRFRSSFENSTLFITKQDCDMDRLPALSDG